MSASRVPLRLGKAARFCALALATFVLVWLSGPRSLGAAPRRTAIALVTGGAGPELGARVRAELEAVGWRVVDVDAEGEVALAKIARRARTLAVVRVGQEAEGIEVWVAPEVDAQARSEWIDVESARPDLAVVLAVESLRARFVELGIEPEGSATQRPVVQEAPRPPAPGTPASGGALPLWIGASGGVLESRGGLPASASLRGQLRLVPLPVWALAVELWWSPSTTELRAAEGASDVRVLLAAVSTEYRREAERFTGALGGGIALAALELRGRPSSGYDGRNDRILTALPFLRGAAELALARRLRLRLDGSLGVSVPRAVVRFGERDAATWGRPLVGVALGVEWAVLDPG